MTGTVFNKQQGLYQISIWWFCTTNRQCGAGEGSTRQVSK